MVTDDATMHDNGFHHFRYPMPLCLLGEKVDERTDHKTTECRRQQSPHPGDPVNHGEEICTSAKEYALNEFD